MWRKVQTVAQIITHLLALQSALRRIFDATDESTSANLKKRDCGLDLVPDVGLVVAAFKRFEEIRPLMCFVVVSNISLL